jgi:hypothetical protein
MTKTTENKTERFALTRHKDGKIIGHSVLTTEQFAHYNAMAQQPEGLMRLGNMPHAYYDLLPEYQDTHEDTTVYLD